MSVVVRVALVSDTHAPRRWKGCPPALADGLRGVDLILHAGDVCTPDVITELAAFAPVRVVRGNNDGPDLDSAGIDAPDRLQFDLAGLPVAMVHDAGVARGRTARMRRWFPDAALVVFGHSHIPLDETGDGVRIVNPGSPTDRRRRPHGTYGLLEIRRGRLAAARIVPLP